MKKNMIRNFWFLVPNLLYLSVFLLYFNLSVDKTGSSFEILFSDVITMGIFYFVIFSILYYLLKLKFNDMSNCLIRCILVMFTFKTLISYCSVIIFLLLVLLAYFMISEFGRFFIVFMFSFVICFIFVFNCIGTFKGLFYLNSSYIDDYEIKSDFYVEEGLDKPNIYWIHADAMINLEDANKYFKVDNSDIVEYFDSNSFYYDVDSSFWGGNHTITALNALLNPEYYDDEYYTYLSNLFKMEKGEPVKDFSFLSYRDLENIRFNNELFTGLKRVGYDIAVITEYNQYSSFDADYIFDYNAMNHNDNEKLLYYGDNSIKELKNHANIVRLRTLSDLTVFKNIFDRLNFLDYEIIDYDNYDFSSYPAINRSDYWKARAMLKSIDYVNSVRDDSNSLFTFVDFSIMHPPWIYDEDGNEFTNSYSMDLDDYSALYSHASNLLVDLLKYIRSVDSDAVIIVQGDHGLHLVSAISLMFRFDIESDQSFEFYESTINAVYVPEKYRNGDENYLAEPLNISRYVINNFVGNNYSYVE